jgi:hypothetical protein
MHPARTVMIVVKKTVMRSSLQRNILPSLLLSSLLGAGVATAQTAPSIAAEQVPSYMDNVQRGARLRLDLGGRMVGVGNPDPPVRLELDEQRGEDNDIDLAGAVLFGYDHIAGLPLQADVAGDFGLDVFGDSPVSPFFDDQSRQPRLRLYSAFIGLIGGGAYPALQPFQVNMGRMTEMVESPITYDGAAASIKMPIVGLGRIQAKLWAGIDAPQRLAGDFLSGFTRIDPRAYRETYELNPTFIADPGSVYVKRAAITEPILRPVGGLSFLGRFFGFGVELRHTLMPAQTQWGSAGADLFLPLQRSLLSASYRYETEWLLLDGGLDLRATDFLPRQLGAHADMMTGDGTTRATLVARWQFIEDITVYDGTYRAFAPRQQFDFTLNPADEQLRQRDQIRHLNFGPPQEHIYAFIEAERQLPAGFSVLAHGRVRHHFDAADVDLFRTNLYELGAGATWQTGFAFEAGQELNAGLVNSGEQNGRAYDLKAEGVVSFAESRTWGRFTVLDGSLSTLAELFVRRNDIQTKQLKANGQWSGGLSASVRYDILPFWAVAARMDGDALSPIDALNASYYLGAQLTTSVKFQ